MDGYPPSRSLHTHKAPRPQLHTLSSEENKEWLNQSRLGAHSPAAETRSIASTLRDFSSSQLTTAADTPPPPPHFCDAHQPSREEHPLDYLFISFLSSAPARKDAFILILILVLSFTHSLQHLAVLSSMLWPVSRAVSVCVCADIRHGYTGPLFTHSHSMLPIPNLFFLQTPSHILHRRESMHHASLHNFTPTALCTHSPSEAIHVTFHLCCIPPTSYQKTSSIPQSVAKFVPRCE